MPRKQTRRQPEALAATQDYGYTLDPDALESERTLGRVPLYQEEAGIRPGVASTVTLEACTHCGVLVLVGLTDHGALLPVEPQTSTYSVLWLPLEAYPRLKPGRGYPAHQCRQEAERQAVMDLPEA